MGKKISVDSANLMNKVFEVIEAYRIFNFDKKYKIIIHPQSYVHSIVRFKNGLIKMVLYNPDMKIPISKYFIIQKNYFPNIKINSELLNNLNFQKLIKKFFRLQTVSKMSKTGSIQHQL